MGSGGGAVSSVQILPFNCGAHPAADVGSLAILQFSAAPRLGVAYLGGASGGVLLEGQADLAAYDRMFEHLRAFALSPAQSALLLRDLTAPKDRTHMACAAEYGERRHRTTTIQRPRRPAG